MRNDAEGYVYVQTNDASSNEVFVFGRAGRRTVRVAA